MSEIIWRDESNLPYTAEMLQRREERLSAEPSFVCVECGAVAVQLTPYGRICDGCLERGLALVAWRIRAAGHLETCCDHEMTWLFDDQAEPGTALYLCQRCGEMRRVELPERARKESGNEPDIAHTLYPLPGVPEHEIVLHPERGEGFYLSSGQWWTCVSKPKLTPQDYRCVVCRRPAAQRGHDKKWYCERCLP